MSKKVFLGGTCNGSKWRDELIPKLKIDYFNPVVEDWTPECDAEEIRQRETCDYCLYVLTPLMTGYTSIEEVVDDSNKRTEKTIMVVLPNDGGTDFTPHQIKSLNHMKRTVAGNGATVIDGLENLAVWLNTRG